MTTARILMIRVSMEMQGGYGGGPRVMSAGPVGSPQQEGGGEHLGGPPSENDRCCSVLLISITSPSPG